jgi:hypothetical protein
MKILLLCGAGLLWGGAAVAQTQIDLRSQAKKADFSAASMTKPFQTGTVLPATCTVGQSYFKADAPAGANIYACTSANVWTVVGAKEMPGVAGNAGTALTTDGASAAWTRPGGDVSGALANLKVSGLQGRAVTSAAPGDGNVLQWKSATSQWEAGSGGIPNYAVDFTAQTSILIPGTQHALGTPNLVVSCYDGSVPARRVEPDTVSVNPVGLDVRITFAVAQTGRCVMNGSGGTPEVAAGSGGSVGAIEVGAGMIMVQTPETTWLSVDGEVVPTTLTASEMVTIPSIAQGACANASLRLPGAVAGDAIAAGWPATMGAGTIGMMWAGSADTVSIRVCNLGTGASVPVTDFFRATTMRRL